MHAEQLEAPLAVFASEDNLIVQQLQNENAYLRQRLHAQAKFAERARKAKVPRERASGEQPLCLN